jgi:hypothetical protein
MTVGRHILIKEKHCCTVVGHEVKRRENHCCRGFMNNYREKR